MLRRTFLACGVAVSALALTGSAFAQVYPAKTGTPGPGLTRLNSEIRPIVLQPEARARLESLAVAPAVGPAVEFGGFTRSEITK